MEADVEKVIKEYAAMDAMASEILSDKQQIIDLDGRRNKGREALRGLKKEKQGTDSHSWMCFGNTFIKMDTPTCIKTLEEDQQTLDVEIERLRDELKPKVSKLHKMEGRAEAIGFDLKGMRLEEELTRQK